MARAPHKSGTRGRVIKKNWLKRVLIVCEGTKTEKNYFKGFKDNSILKNNIIVNNSNMIGDSIDFDINDGNGHTDPSGVLQVALNSFTEKTPGFYESEFDLIFCVIDSEYCTDRLVDYIKTIKKIKSIRFSTETEFHAIGSNPSFEFWYLLHFKKSDKPYSTITGAKSAGDNVGKDLCVYWKSHFGEKYKKEALDHFNKLNKPELISKAIKNSREIYNQSKMDSSYNPCTKMHLFFEKISKIEDDLAKLAT